MLKAVVLFSGGLDSTVNLYKAKKDFSEGLLALSFDYGQRAAEKEIECAKVLCEEINVQHKVINISWFSEFTKTSLINFSKDIPQDKVNIEDSEQSKKTAQLVWVPNRNGVFLNIAAGFAEGLSEKNQPVYVIPGFNAEEAATFPDNSAEFCQAVDKSLSFSTSNKVKVKSYTLELDKVGIVEMALELDAPLKKIWPCYLDQESWCGKCESCLRFMRALQVKKIDIDTLNFTRSREV